MTKCNWKIFIVSHKSVYKGLYRKDKGFNKDNYVILDVNKDPGKLKNTTELNVINQFQLPDPVDLGWWWAESEAIYNLYKNNIHKDLDFIGFIHYDHELKLRDKSKCFFASNNNITSRINKALKGKDKVHIAFETHNTLHDYNQKVMLDETMPNVLQGDGLNCYDYMLKDYNNFFDTNYTIEDLTSKQLINLCSSFLIDIKTFEKLMEFFDWIINSKKLDVFNTDHANRLQGGIAERYFGLFLLFEYEKLVDLSLIHHYETCK